MKMRNGFLLAAAVTLLFSAGVRAQSVPSRVSFTANLKNNSGPVNGAFKFVFTLFDSPVGGTVAWTETWAGLSVSNGLVVADLGSTTPLTKTVFNGAPLFLEVSIDGNTLSPRVSISTVPYAVRSDVALNAERLGNMLPSEVQRRVSGLCSTGAISAIDADGGVTCVSTGTAGSTITGISTAPGSGLAGGTTSGVANLGLATCPNGHVMKSNGTGWSCSPTDGISTVSNGGGITGGVSNGVLALNSDSTVQRRSVAPSCTNSFMTGLAPDGTASCGNPSPGPGLAAVGNGIGIASCPNGQVMKSNGAGYACGEDTAGAIGTGLVGEGTAANPLSLAFAGSGTATTVARGDHAHSATLSCTPRFFTNNGQVGTSVMSAYALCNTGESMTSGWCNAASGSTLAVSYLSNCGPLCACIINTPCPPYGAWACNLTTTSGSVTAGAMCCKVTVN